MKKTIITDLVIAALVMMCCSLSACSGSEELSELTSIISEDEVTESPEENKNSEEVSLKAFEGENSGEVQPERVDEEITELETVPAKIFVHVCGAVKAADVYEMDSDERIVDAIKRAGGFECDASPDYINLAGGIYDGMQIYVPTRKEVEEGYSGPTGNEMIQANAGSASAGTAGAATGQSAAGASSSGKVNINTATEAELKTLNGIGDKRAKDIISYRDSHGAFSSIEDIKKVPGIKDAMYTRISDFIEV